MTKQFSFLLRLAGVLLMPLMGAGCAGKYYRITDGATGKVYHAPKIVQNKKTGEVSFIDTVSGAPVKLKQPAVKTVPRDEFNRAVFSK